MTMAMTDFELHYSISGGYPPVEASLSMTSEAQAAMFLSNSWSLAGEEQDQAGWFAGPIPAEGALTLRQMLTAPSVRDTLLHLQSQQTGKLPLDAVVRKLRLVLAGQPYQIDGSAAGSDRWWSALDALLRQFMHSLIRHPLQALRLEAVLKQEDESLFPTFQISAIGVKPATVVLKDSTSKPVKLCAGSLSLETRVEFPGGGTAWNPQSMLQVPPEHWLHLMEQGNLPAQVRLAPPHTAIVLPLPALDHPSQDAGLYFRGNLSLWASSEDGRLYSLGLQTLRIPLAEALAQ